jgi:cysteine desulfurase
MHADAAQSLGKIPVDVEQLGIDLLSIAGHKLYAPKGIGALYVRRGINLPPLLAGADQESGRRAGTENVAAIVALGTACSIAARVLEDEQRRLSDLAKDLFDRLRCAIPGLTLVGHAEARLPNTLNVLFPDAFGREVLHACPRVLASTGSACHAGSEKPSPVLIALGIAHERAIGAVRLSLGRATTRESIEVAASSLASAWRLVRRYQVAKPARPRAGKTGRSVRNGKVTKRKTAGGSR